MQPFPLTSSRSLGMDDKKGDPQQAYDKRNPCSYMLVVANHACTLVATLVFREDIAYTHATSKPHIAMCAVPGQTHNDVA